MKRIMVKKVIRDKGQGISGGYGPWPMLILIILITAMAQAAYLENAFNSGELDPLIRYRVDLDRKYLGVETMENFLVEPQGLAQRRPGLLFVAEGKVATGIDRPAADPETIKISTPQQLQDMENDLTADYELLNDIDMDGFDFRPIGDIGRLGDGAGNSNFFSGSLNGNFFTISNISYTSDNNIMGLFGGIDTATIENLILKDFELHGDNNMGCLAGECEDSTLTQVGVDGGTITPDQDDGSSGSFFGGLIAEATGTDVVRCWSTAVITIQNFVSAFDNSQVGGLIGSSSGAVSILDCWAGGDIVLSEVADPDDHAFDSGGFFGRANSMSPLFPKRCHSYGAVITAGSQAADVSHRVGGFTGRYSFTDYTDCHWDTDTSTLTWGAHGQSPPLTGLTGHVTSVSQQQATYTTWDFDTVWEIDEGNGYPTLRWVSDAANMSEPTSNDKIHLISFEFATTDAYVIEAGNQYLRFYRDE